MPEPILRGAIVHELWVAARYAHEVSSRALRAAGVDPDEYGFLSIVGTLQPVTRTGLAAATGLRRTTLRDAVRPLIERGHVVESPHPQDGRATLLTLTPAGQEVFEKEVESCGFKRVETPKTGLKENYVVVFEKVDK